MFYITSLDGSNIFCQRTSDCGGGVQGWLLQLLPSTSWCIPLLMNYILLLLLTIFCTHINIFTIDMYLLFLYFTKAYPNSVYSYKSKRQCLMFLAPSEAIYFVNEGRGEKGRVGYGTGVIGFSANFTPYPPVWEGWRRGSTLQTGSVTLQSDDYTG